MPVPYLEIAFLAATGMQAFGQYKGASDSKKAANYNASIYDQQVSLFDEAKKFDVYRIERAKEKAFGAQRAGYAKAGVTSEGTPFEVMADTAFNYELDKAITVYNYEVQKSQARSQASQARMQAKMLGRESIISPLTTLASGAASYAYLKNPNFGATAKTAPKAKIPSYYNAPLVK